MNRRSRFLAAVIAIAALLFSQLAVSGHGCPGAGDMDAAMQAMAANDAAPMDMTLCERHCNASAKAYDVAKPAAAMPPAVLPALRIAQPHALPLATVRVPAPIAAGSAPPFLRTTVLRI